MLSLSVGTDRERSIAVVDLPLARVDRAPLDATFEVGAKVCQTCVSGTGRASAASRLQEVVALKQRGDAVNGAHHAFPRGNSGMAIFRDNADRQVLLVLLKGVVDAYGWDLRAYCLMRNHFHLVVITATVNFSRGMQRLLSAYVRYFNHRHERGGHLFKRPFKSEPIKDERQLAIAISYVGDNPVRAGICRGAGEYRWSSHGEGDDAHRAALMHPKARV